MGDIEFKNLEFIMYPPGIIAHDVSFKQEIGEKKDVKIDLLLKKLGVYFSVFDFFGKKISLKRIVAMEGVVKVDGVFEDGKYLDINKNISNSFLELFTPTARKWIASDSNLELSYKNLKSFLDNNLPFTLREVRLSQIQIFTSSISPVIKEFGLINSRKNLLFTGDVENLDISNIHPLKQQDIDSIKLRLEANERRVNLSEFELRSGQDFLAAKGNYQGLLDKNMNGNWKILGEFNFELEELLYSLGRQELTQKREGVFTGNFKLSGNSNKFSGQGAIEGFSVNTDFVEIKSLSSNIRFNNNNISIEDLELRNNNERYYLSESFYVYSLKDKRLLPNPITLVVENGYTNTFLKSIKDSMDPLKAHLSGKVKITYDEESFLFSVQPEANIKNLKLVFDQSLEDVGLKKIKEVREVVPVLDFNELKMDKGEFRLNLSNLSVDIDGLVKYNDSIIEMKGKIEDKSVSFQSKQIDADLGDLGKFGGLSFLGRGILGLKIAGSTSDAVMSLEGIWKEAEFLNFRLGDVEVGIDIHLGKNKITIRKGEGLWGKSPYSIIGDVRLGKEVGLDLSVLHEDASYEDLKEIYKNYLTDLTFMPENMYGVLTGKFDILGPADLKKLEISGAITSANIVIYNEQLNKVFSNFSYKGGSLSFDKIQILKQDAELSGNVEVGLFEDFTKFDLILRNAELREFFFYDGLPIGVNGVLNGKSVGEMKGGVLTTDTGLQLQKSRIENKSVPDSQITIKSKGVVFDYYLDVMNKEAWSRGHVVFDEEESSNEKLSNINLKVNSQKINRLIGLFFPHNFSDRYTRGKLVGSLKSSFNINNWRTIDLDLALSDFNYKRKSVWAKKTNGRDHILIENGNIKKWNLFLDGQGFYASSTGSGTLRDKFEVKNELEVSHSLVEILSEKLSSSGGIISANLLFQDDQGGIKGNGSFSSKQIGLSMEGLPASFSNVDAEGTFNNEKIFIEKLTGNFGGGTLEASGDISIGKPFPHIKVYYQVKNSILNFFKKSKFLISGEGSLTGNAPPYKLNGNFLLGKSEVLDEVDDLGGEDESELENIYIPKLVKRQKIEFLEFNLVVDVMDEVKVKNSYGEMLFTGNLKVLGTPNRPNLGGQFSIVPGSGRFFFKSNDFILSRGNINFRESEQEINPEIEFLGKSKISEYTVEVGVIGRAKDFEIKLSSDPPLSNQDILSLLTIGVTGDVSRNINDRDRESLTGVGIGSILFDKFRFNENLANSLGIKFRVSSEFIEAEDSLLSGRSGDSGGAGTSKLRSSTKVQLQKRINEELDVSVSSTLGGSIGQKQEMNLNYKLNDNVSLQGVYEVKTDNSGDDATNESSIGADLKFKWSFK